MEVRPPRIILMDASDASREVMAGRLSAQGYKVEVAPDLGGGEVAGERLRQTVERLVIPYGSASISVSVSIGLAELRPGERLDSVIDRADRAMYSAKVGGRNRLVVDRDDLAGRAASAPAALSAQ